MAMRRSILALTLLVAMCADGGADGGTAHPPEPLDAETCEALAEAGFDRTTETVEEIQALCPMLSAEAIVIHLFSYAP